LARKKKQAAHENHERWLVSYADFITLLFAFFVVMFASSQTDKSKAKQVSESVTEAMQNGGVQAAVHEILGGTVDEKGKGNAQMKGPGGSQPKNEPPAKAEKLTEAQLMPSMKYLSQVLQNEIKAGKLDIRMEPRGMVLSLRQATFFPSGEDAVDPGTLPSLDKIGATIKDLGNDIRLEGHTDSIPIHTDRFKSNWELSAGRAIAMLDLLTSRYQIRRDRLAIAGYAETMPVDTNDTADGRAHNRRVDVVILAEKVLAGDPNVAEPKPVAAQPSSGDGNTNVPGAKQPAATPQPAPAAAKPSAMPGPGKKK
jgi:chemotaxis protein MotB